MKDKGIATLLSQAQKIRYILVVLGDGLENPPRVASAIRGVISLKQDDLPKTFKGNVKVITAADAAHALFLMVAHSYTRVSVVVADPQDRRSEAIPSILAYLDPDQIIRFNPRISFSSFPANRVTSPDAVLVDLWKSYRAAKNAFKGGYVWRGGLLSQEQKTERDKELEARLGSSSFPIERDWTKITEEDKRAKRIVPAQNTIVQHITPTAEELESVVEKLTNRQFPELSLGDYTAVMGDPRDRRRAPPDLARLIDAILYSDDMSVRGIIRF